MGCPNSLVRVEWQLIREPEEISNSAKGVTGAGGGSVSHQAIVIKKR